MNALLVAILSALNIDVQSLSSRIITLAEHTNLGFMRVIAKMAADLAEAKQYADTKKQEAIDAANSYTDTEIEQLDSDLRVHISSQKQDAIDTAAGYTDSAIATEVQNRNAAILTAKNEAKDHADSKVAQEVTDRNSAISAAISQEVIDRNSAIATSQSASENYAAGLVAQEVTARNSAIATTKATIESDYQAADTALSNRISELEIGSANYLEALINPSASAGSLNDAVLAAYRNKVNDQNASLPAGKTFVFSLVGDVEGEQTLSFNGTDYTVSSGESFIVETDANGVSSAAYRSNPFMEAITDVKENIGTIKTGLETIHSTFGAQFTLIDAKLTTLLATVNQLPN